AANIDDTNNHVLSPDDSSNMIPLRKLSVERQANLAQQNAENQLDLKADGKLTPHYTNKSSTATDNQKHRSGISQEKLGTVKHNVPVKQDITNERPDNSRANNILKNQEHSLKLPSSGNNGQRNNHETLLNLQVTQSASDSKYTIAGNLMDKTTRSPLQGKTIIFTTTPPIRIGDQITNKAGSFNSNILIPQGTAWTVKMQAHFERLDLYDATDSKTIILKIDASKSGTPFDYGTRK